MPKSSLKDEIGSKRCQQSSATGRNDYDDPRRNLPDRQENKLGQGKTEIAGPSNGACPEGRILYLILSSPAHRNFNSPLIRLHIEIFHDHFIVSLPCASSPIPTALTTASRALPRCSVARRPLSHAIGSATVCHVRRFGRGHFSCAGVALEVFRPRVWCQIPWFGSEYFISAVAVGAGIAVILATLTGFPISTTPRPDGRDGRQRFGWPWGSQINLGVLGKAFFLRFC